jgi:hypothetical protein
MSPRTAADAEISSIAVISNDRGSIALPAVLDSEMVDGVVWLPSRAPGLGVPQHLAATAGDLVTIRAAELMGAELVEARPSTGAVLSSSKGTRVAVDDTEASQ